jgi:hypothetical protein
MTMKEIRPVIGIDIGGVIIDRTNDAADTSFFGPNYLASIAMPGAFDIIGKLARERFKVYLVSKCGPQTEAKTKQWLKHNGFYEATGVLPIDVRFCRERKDKAQICRKLGITHFVDDRLEVLWHMKETVCNLYLLASVPSEVRKFAHALPYVLPVKSWEELGHILLHQEIAADTAS